MSKQPIIIGSVGGLNPAGRSGNFSSYGFMIRDALPEKLRSEIVLHQARLMNRLQWQDGGWRESQTGGRFDTQKILEKFDPVLNDACFIRKPQAPLYFDPYASPANQKVTLNAGEWLWPKRNLPQPLPESWEVIGEDPASRSVKIRLKTSTEIYVSKPEKLDVSCGGLIPDGVTLESTGFGGKSEKIPRTIKLGLYGANDAMKSLGITFQEIAQVVSQNEIGVYVGTSMGQLDAQGSAGFIQGALVDERIHSTSLPFSFLNMAADFVAAYMFGSLGHISCEVGACATFLFNLYNAVRDIRSGAIKFALVGSSDAPIEPWVYSAYNAMKALARDESLRSRNLLKGDDLDRSRASIPFGDNFGFTLAEGSQFVTLFHPDLARHLGVQPLGALGEVFCHSDGFKDSISRPGLGNYLTVGRAMGSLRREMGEEFLRNQSFLSAHGSSTPLNRQTESKLLDELAQAFGIKDWPVTAVKSWLGHTLGAASGDQLLCALGAFHYGTINRIRNLEEIPEDVSRKNLSLCKKHLDISKHAQNGFSALINSKGFGGQNATAVVYGPQLAKTWLLSGVESRQITDYEKRCEKAREKQRDWEERFLKGAEMIDYYPNRTAETAIEALSDEGIKIKGFSPLIRF